MDRTFHQRNRPPQDPEKRPKPRGMAAPRCHGPRSRGSHVRTTASPLTLLFFFVFVRCARPRGGGRGFRLPLPRSGLRCPVFASGVVAPSQKADRCPCSASAVSAAGSASATQPAAAPCFVHRTRSPPLPLPTFLPEKSVTGFPWRRGLCGGFWRSGRGSWWAWTRR